MSNWSRDLFGRSNLSGSFFSGINSITGSLVMSGSADIRGVKKYSELYGGQIALIPITGELIIPLANASVFQVDVTEDIDTITINNGPEGASGFTLLFKNNINVPPFAYTVTWNPIRWPGGVAPVLGGNLGQVDIISVFRLDPGGDWYGFEGGINFS